MCDKDITEMQWLNGFMLLARTQPTVITPQIIFAKIGPDLTRPTDHCKN